MPFQKNVSYTNPDLVKRIYELRTSGESFHKISSIIFEEFGIKITDPTTKNVYTRFVAKNLVVQQAKEQRLAGDVVPDYQKKMEERFDKIAKVTDDLMDTLTEMKENMEPEMYVKTIPTVLMVAREILNQLNYIKKEQSQVLINQKNIIYSPLQIMQIVNNELTKLEKEGKIEIKEKKGRILTDKEKENIFLPVRSEQEVEVENEVL